MPILPFGPIAALAHAGELIIVDGRFIPHDRQNTGRSIRQQHGAVRVFNKLVDIFDNRRADGNQIRIVPVIRMPALRREWGQGAARHGGSDAPGSDARIAE